MRNEKGQFIKGNEEGFKSGDENYSQIYGVWNKGLKTGANPEHSQRMKGRIPWNKNKTGCQEAWNKDIHTGHTPWNKGKPHVYIIGEKNHNWKGGISLENRKIRESIEYAGWRQSVFERDNYTCKLCGNRGGEIHADHIKPFSLYPDERLNMDNGRTLCKRCHKKYGWELFKNMNPRKQENTAIAHGLDITGFIAP